MSAGFQLAVVGMLCVLLAVVSAVAGALWWRLRSLPFSSADDLARDLADRLHAIQVEAARKSVRNDSALGRQNGAGTAIRVDSSFATAHAGPTLIVVPDLAAQHSSHEPTPAIAELSRRFGMIWELADSGASAEQVARSTGLPVGHVELILGLRRQLEAASALPASGGETQ